jgi:molybdopterin molybdotransferase
MMQGSQWQGFAVLRPVEEAWAWIDRNAPAPQAQLVRVQDAQDRVLADDVLAPADGPEFPLAMADGYALRATETVGAGLYHPLELAIVGAASPGQPFRGSLPAGSAVRIAVGGRLPDGADGVLPLEQAEEWDSRLEVNVPIAPGENVRQEAAEYSRHGLLLRAGRRLRPQDTALLGAAGIERVRVFRGPKVRVVAIGSELEKRQRGGPIAPDINTPMLKQLIFRDGGEVERTLVLGDDEEAIREALTAAGADVILTVGASGAGFNDAVGRIASAMGDVPFHGLALPAAKSSGLGHVGVAMLCLLPGNPASCFIAYDFFAGRAIRLAAGRDGNWPYAERHAVAVRKVVSGLGRVDYVPFRYDEGGADPLSSGEMPTLAVLAQANGFIVVPTLSEGFAEGEKVPIYLFR